MYKWMIDELKQDIGFLDYKLQNFKGEKLGEMEMEALKNLKANIENLVENEDMFIHTKILRPKPKKEKKLEKIKNKIKTYKYKKDLGYIAALALTIFSLLFYNTIERQQDKENIAFLQNDLQKQAAIELKNIDLKRDLSICRQELNNKKYMFKTLKKGEQK